MENNNKNGNQIQIELTPDVAKGIYSNLAVISHGPAEFFLDFITLAPNMPQAKVQSRIIMTPENVENLLYALGENVQRYEATFGEIRRTTPKNQPQNPGETPNPFMNGGKLN